MKPEYPDTAAASLSPASRGRPLEDSVFPVVGIGASAGGLEAFTQLLANLPDETGMAFVLVQHLDPDHESQLADLLSKATRLPVAEVADGMSVLPNHIYVIPPNTSMVIAGEVLKLSPRGEARSQHLPLNIFFRSLAEDRQSRAIGVILSGTGSDGSMGVAEIKAVGGLTFAQDENSAKFPAMPLNAIGTGCIDFVLPPDKIAGELVRIGQHPYLRPAPAGDAEPEAKDDFNRIMARLRSGTGVDFGHYRDATIRRRIARRMAIQQSDSLTQYAQLLERSPPEVEALYGDILINVTSFFRDPDVFEALKHTVFPEIVKNKSPETPIRIWVAGCSTGQEVYSLAIVLLEFLDQEQIRPPIQLFGTDINDAVSVEKARAGLYPLSIESEVSPERLRRFFSREDHGYRIGKSIRQMCVFSRQNVAADPPFSRLDMVSCRNLLIYLSGSLQKRIIPTFHYALNPGGYLLLGTSETVGLFTDLFDRVDKQHSIYAKKPTVEHHPYPYFAGYDHQAKAPGAGGSAGQRPADVADMQKEADRVILGQYAPAGVLVNEEFEILQFRGSTGPYLEPAPGAASFNLLRMARGSLFIELRGAVEEARKLNAATRRKQVSVQDQREAREVDLQVIPIRPAGSDQRCFLILFEESRKPAAAESGKGDVAAPQGGQATPPDSPQIEQLTRELAESKEYLQAIIEQQSAANEELQSANEEILSSNEELQSTNEELQTAKEELQSANEELQTTNDELASRNQEVGKINDDLTNTLASVKIPIVMLGPDLRIRRFTPTAGAALNLIPSDLGRPLGDLRPSFGIPDLEEKLLNVIATVAAQELEIQDRDGRWFLLRMHPYRTADNRIDGVVLVLLDIDERRRVEEMSRRLAAIVQSSDDAIIGESLDGAITSWNLGAERMFGYAAEEVVGKPISMLLPPDRADEMTQIQRRLQTGERVEHFETVRICKHGRPIDVSLTASAVRGGAGRLIGISNILRDTTDRKLAEEQLRKAKEEAEAADRTKDRFLAVLSHELRTPLTPVLATVSMLQEDTRFDADTRENLEVVRRNVELEARLIDDLLDVTRIAHGKLELNRRPIIISDILKQMADVCMPDIEARRVHFGMDIENTPHFVEVDAGRMQQVFWNLLRNAIKFTAPGGCVGIRCWREHTQVVTEINDSGVGIAPEVLPHLFEPFEQGGARTTRQFGGLGLGLSICRSLVEMHGGTIEARSKGEGKGATFTVRFPICEPPPETVASKPFPDVSQSPDVSRRLRILLVEDHGDTARILKRMLVKYGHEVQTAGDAATATELAVQGSFDLLISDLGLPDASGVDLLWDLRARGLSMPAIALTGYGQEEDLVRTKSAGFSEHLVKPIDFSLFRQVVDRFAQT